MSTATLALPNAILFLFDRSNKAVNVPEYVDGQLVSSNDSCLSVGTQADVDGDVTVSLETGSSSSPLNGLTRVFAGVLHTPNHRLAVVTADARTIFECSVASDRPGLEVWADDLKNPARITIIAR